MMQQLATWISERRALPYRFRKSVVKRIYPKILKEHAFEMEFFGLKYQGNTSSDIDRVTYFCGAYEKYMLFFLRDLVKHLDKKDIIFWDVGANVGNHALFMSRLVKQVHAFEPYGPIIARLDNNIKINDIKNIAVHPFGLGSENKSLPFYAPPPGIQGNGSFVEGCNEGNSFHAELQIRVADELVAQGTPAPQVMKLDVEGFEKEVLRGMQKTIRSVRPVIIFELLEKTREQFMDANDMESLFPGDYTFLRFEKASRDGGAYTVAPFDFSEQYKRKDVVACPTELIDYIPGLNR